MYTKLVSVIIPVYNGEVHIKRCIESILNQTYSELEVIIVNDGSKDNTAVFCEEFVKADSRVNVYHTENRGVSPTRNFGISKAKGYYIQFVDSDDYLAPTATQNLVENMESQPRPTPKRSSGKTC